MHIYHILMYNQVLRIYSKTFEVTIKENIVVHAKRIRRSRIETFEYSVKESSFFILTLSRVNASFSLSCFFFWFFLFFLAKMSPSDCFSIRITR